MQIVIANNRCNNIRNRYYYRYGARCSVPTMRLWQARKRHRTNGAIVKKDKLTVRTGGQWRFTSSIAASMLCATLVNGMTITRDVPGDIYPGN